MTAGVVSNTTDVGVSLTAVSTSISSALSTATSSVTSLSTAVGSGGGVAAGNIWGLQLAPDATSTVLDITAGQATDSTNVATLTLASAFTKAIGTAWAAGTGNGSLDTGAVANATWYHVFIISKAGGASPDILTSVSATAPTMPSTYTLFRRIGSFLTNGSAQVTPFTQFADEFYWNTWTSQINTFVADANAHLIAVTVPTGIKVVAHLLLSGSASVGGDSIIYTSPDMADQAPGSSFPYTQTEQTSQILTTAQYLRTNTSGQIRYRGNLTSQVASIQTLGWRDDRGRNQ